MNADQRPASEQRRGPVPRRLLWGFAIGGTCFGVAGTTLALVVLLGQRAGPPPVPPTSELPPTAELEPPAQHPAPSGAPPPPAPTLKPAEWQTRLFAKVCPSPCRGGSACPVTKDNAGSRLCRRRKEFCSKCTSEITCIPGSAKSRLEAGEPWQLHLSMIYAKRYGRRVPNPCRSNRDLWLCIKPSTATAWDCAALSDACQNAGGAAKGIAVTSDDLLISGLDVQVRAGGADGRIVAQREHATYSSLGRAALCSGFRMAFPGSKHVEMFTFFLMPPRLDKPD